MFSVSVSADPSADNWQILSPRDGGNEKCWHNQSEKTVMTLLGLSHDPVNFMCSTQLNTMLLVWRFWELLYLQVGRVLLECGWSKPSCLTEQILKDMLFYHSRTELKKIVWNLQSFYLFRLTLSPLKNSALFQKSQRRLCIVLLI